MYQKITKELLEVYNSNSKNTGRGNAVDRDAFKKVDTLKRPYKGSNLTKATAFIYCYTKLPLGEKYVSPCTSDEMVLWQELPQYFTCTAISPSILHV